MRRRNREARPGLTRTGVGEVGGLFAPYTEDRGGPNAGGGYGAWARTYWGLGYPTPELARRAVRCRDRGEPAPDGGVPVDRATGARVEPGGIPDGPKGPPVIPWGEPVRPTPAAEVRKAAELGRRSSVPVDDPAAWPQGGPADG